MNITVNNYGTINVYVREEAVSKAKDTLLNLMYYARLSPNVIGGYEGWLKLLDMYHRNNFKGMKAYISQCRGRCGTRRQEMLRCIDTIMKGEKF